MPRPAFLAVDWGTTRLRAWVVDEAGAAIRGRDFAFGVSRLAPGEARTRFLETVRPSLRAEALPALLCGMVGSDLGWKTVPYLDCPAGLGDLAGGLGVVEAPGPPVLIVPGLKTRRGDGEPDVMRGEETQILGWAETDPAAHDRRLVCHPGTHAKWVRVEDRRITAFATAMTGELFDLLRRHSVLPVHDGEDDEAAFNEGLAAAGDGGALAARLFTVRARVASGRMAQPRARSFLSGLLIGAEVAALPALVGAQAGEPVVLMGENALCRRYARALEARGRAVHAVPGESAALAGLSALYFTKVAA